MNQGNSLDEDMSNLTRPRRAVVVGAAGFIGSHVASTLLERGWSVLGIDCLSCYYAPILKKENLDVLGAYGSFKFLEMQFVESEIGNVASYIDNVDAVLDAAAIPGVHYSIKNAEQVMAWNCATAAATSKLAKAVNASHYIYLSSSSVYGAADLPFDEESTSLNPLSPYAQSKVRSEDIIAANLAAVPITSWIVRLFAVYGPRIRPDLALAKFSRMILHGQEICITGGVAASRDFTYVADVAAILSALLDLNTGKLDVINVARGQAVNLGTVLDILSHLHGRRARLVIHPKNDFEPMHTLASIVKLHRLLGKMPGVGFEQGIALTAPWLKEKLRQPGPFWDG